MLSQVLRFAQDGWPDHVDAELQPFLIRKNELSIEVGCLMKVIIPSKLQKWVLDELHTSHPGIVRMKSITRTKFWWPKITTHIEELVRSCLACQSNRNKPPTTTLHPWNWPAKPWQRVHIDFAGPFMDKMFLIVVEAHSK